MELTSIRALYRERDGIDHAFVRVGGWVRSIRASKSFGFIMLSDGTFFEPIQIVYDDTLENFAEISVKNFALLNKKVQSIKLVFKDGVKLNWAARIVEKEFPYQEANFTVFMNKYKKQ